ncbi:MAG: hypothetical protein BWX88_05366 [Planctomycetes bacterium ADurb.Bin126]|nr:MAG: hypothetical protein BWX88_05366 [Planctomycetes bacterium ADurb.Bin126]
MDRSATAGRAPAQRGRRRSSDRTEQSRCSSSPPARVGGRPRPVGGGRRLRPFAYRRSCVASGPRCAAAALPRTGERPPLAGFRRSLVDGPLLSSATAPPRPRPSLPPPAAPAAPPQPPAGASGAPARADATRQSGSREANSPRGAMPFASDIADSPSARGVHRLPGVPLPGLPRASARRRRQSPGGFREAIGGRPPRVRHRSAGPESARPCPTRGSGAPRCLPISIPACGGSTPRSGTSMRPTPVRSVR